MAEVIPQFKTKPTKKRPNRKVTTWRKAVQDVKSRSGGWCEANVPGVCIEGRHKAHHVHHVILRSQGGPDEPWNLLHVCNTAHDWAHNVDRAEAERLGIIRRRAS